MAQSKPCSPSCQAFKCGKNAVFYQRNAVWCRDTEELCKVANCTYSMCMKRRMLPRGICGETVHRVTVEKDLDDLDEPVRLKGKALRKFGDKDFY